MKDKNKQLNEMLENYAAQTSKNEKLTYDDEIRAEADLISECCSCCRVCCIANS